MTGCQPCPAIIAHRFRVVKRHCSRLVYKSRWEERSGRSPSVTASVSEAVCPWAEGDRFPVALLMTGRRCAPRGDKASGCPVPTEIDTAPVVTRTAAARPSWCAKRGGLGGDRGRLLSSGILAPGLEGLAFLRGTPVPGRREGAGPCPAGRRCRGAACARRRRTCRGTRRRRGRRRACSSAWPDRAPRRRRRGTRRGRRVRRGPRRAAPSRPGAPGGRWRRG
jgi:hypothetical protein